MAVRQANCAGARGGSRGCDNGGGDGGGGGGTEYRVALLR